MSSTREQLVKEYDSKLDEYAALLDIRANRIKVTSLDLQANCIVLSVVPLMGWI